MGDFHPSSFQSDDDDDEIEMGNSEDSPVQRRSLYDECFDSVSADIDLYDDDDDDEEDQDDDYDDEGDNVNDSDISSDLLIMRYHDDSFKSKKNSGYACVAGMDGMIPFGPTLDDLAIYPISPELRCPICFDLFREAVFGVPCGHTFCRQCLVRNQEASGTSRCPTCRGTISPDSLPPALIVRNLINSITVCCLNGISYNVSLGKYETCKARNRCSELMKLEERENHIANCPYTLIRCKYSDDGCSHVMERRHEPSHLAKCPFQSIWCVCGQRIRSCHTSIHDEVCESKEVACPNVKWGCQTVKARSVLHLHMAMCPFEAVREILERKNEENNTLLKKMKQLEESMIDMRFTIRNLQAENEALRKQKKIYSTCKTDSEGEGHIGNNNEASPSHVNDFSWSCSSDLDQSQVSVSTLNDDLAKKRRRPVRV